MTQAWTDGGCRTGDVIVLVQPGTGVDKNGDGGICSSGTHEYDNRLPGGKGGGGGNGGGWTAEGCHGGDQFFLVQPGTGADANGDGGVCYSGTDFYDNRLPGGNGGGNGGGWTAEGCRSGDEFLLVQPGTGADANGDGGVCYSGTDFYDNRI